MYDRITGTVQASFRQGTNLSCMLRNVLSCIDLGLDIEQSVCVCAPQALAHSVVASCVYGPVHLLRLLCKLPTLMPMAQVKEDDQKVIEEQLVLLVAFLKQQHGPLFEQPLETQGNVQPALQRMHVTG